MTYTLLSVIVLSLVYLVIIFKKYNQVTDANQPHIKQLKQQIEKLTNGIETETKLAKAARLNRRRCEGGRFRHQNADIDRGKRVS